MPGTPPGSPPPAPSTPTHPPPLPPPPPPPYLSPYPFLHYFPILSFTVSPHSSLSSSISPSPGSVLPVLLPLVVSRNH